jgi:hypothetical protein
MTDKLCHAFKRLVLSAGLVGAVWVSCVEPMVWKPSWATASPQPALVSDQAAPRLAPTGFDQAQTR